MPEFLIDPLRLGDIFYVYNNNNNNNSPHASCNSPNWPDQKLDVLLESPYINGVMTSRMNACRSIVASVITIIYCMFMMRVIHTENYCACAFIIWFVLFFSS